MEEDIVPEVEKITEQVEDSVVTTGWTIWHKLGVAIGVVILQVLLILLVKHLFKRLNRRAEAWSRAHIKPLVIKKLHILSTDQITGVLLFGLKVLKYVIMAFQLFITIPIVFSLFPATEHIASTIFGYILTPLKNIFWGIVDYIPNLFTIVIICIVNRYVLRGLKFFASMIDMGKLVIPGFYEDWAKPTFNILRFLLYAFTLAIIFPLLPGSDSKFFQGISVFVGVIFSLGSSSAIGNLVAGLVMTYMRPFKIGDRIQIQGSIGFVVEKSLMVVRIKTHKNEYITFPNMMILSSNIINYNTSSDEDEEGLILYADITFGYNTPWQLVHEVLIEAALATDHVLASPKPFVLQTAMDDFYCRYQINCYTKKVAKVPRIYSQLYQNLQNGFHARGIDMTAAHYRINLPPEAGGDPKSFMKQ